MNQTDMTPELETLDQLLGGDLTLKIISQLYPDVGHFLRGVHGLLKCGEVRLLEDDAEVPEHRWRELFVDGEVMEVLDTTTLSITVKGAERIG